LRADPGVHQGLIVVSLADFSDTSLRVQILYSPPIPDWESTHGDPREVNFGDPARMRGPRGALQYPDPVIRMDAPEAAPAP